MRLPSRSVLLLAATAFAVTGCASSTGAGDGGDAPGVAATVAGVEISTARIEEIAEAQEPLLDEVPEEELDEARAQLRRDALSAEIQLRAVETAVDARFGLDISDADVETALQEQIEAQGGQDAFEALAAEQGLEPDQAIEFAREGAYITALVEYLQEQLEAEGGPEEAELRTQFEAEKESFQTSTARHILVETEPEAQDVLDRLDAGEDFGDLAMELSTDPGSGANGGELGEAPRGTYVGPFGDAIYSDDTVLGEVVGPVETQFGFHLIIVDERTTPTFDEVRPQLEERAAGGAFNDFLDGIFADLEVEVDPFYGEWDAAQRAVVAPVEDATDEGDADGGADDEG